MSLRVSTGYEGKPLPSHLPTTFTVREALTSSTEIRSICKKSLLRALAEVTEDFHEKRRLEELCSRQGAQDHTKFVLKNQVCVLDVLHLFPSCRPSAELILQHLPALKMRSYSVVDSPNVARPKSVRFAFTVVVLPASTHRKPGERLGVCTNYLKNLPLGGVVQLKHRKSLSFKLPEDHKTPIIMIGPGTGVAPFLGFVQQRSLDETREGEKGENHLYFGCRHPDQDFLFEEELKEFEKSGKITSLNVAHSRLENFEHKYVQDLLTRDSTRVYYDVTERGATVFVCGDARGMSKGVRECFVKIFMKEGGLEEKEAKNMLRSLTKEKRYKEDVWA